MVRGIPHNLTLRTTTAGYAALLLGEIQAVNQELNQLSLELSHPFLTELFEFCQDMLWKKFEEEEWELRKSLINSLSAN